MDKDRARAELYVHPSYQGARDETPYRKTYDIYGLGIILLEISHWKTVDRILGLDPKRITVAGVADILQRLLAHNCACVEEVAEELGGNYKLAMQCCLVGSTTNAIPLNDGESSVW